MKEEQSTSLHEGSVAVVPQKAEKKSGKRIGFNYIILKSLKESKKNDVVKCIYIKGITSFGLCVIKEGSRGDTKDSEGRDIQDRLKWQRTLHERLAGKVRVPKYLGSFEENGNYYLVIEFIKGKSLHNIVKKDRQLRKSLLEGGESGLRLLDYLKKVVKLVAELHREQVVHRDVTLNNFMIMPSGKVAVIDLELSYSLSDRFPAPPFALGTHGYMSPEQEVVSMPTEKEDIFSLGAIILTAWSGISPFKFVKIPAENFQRSVNFFVEDEEIASLIGQCMQRDPKQRPGTDTILQRLEKCTEDLKRRKKIQITKKEFYTSVNISETIQKGIAALSEPLMCDQEKGWFAEHLVERSESTNEIRKTWYASFNRGVAGVLYYLSRAKAAGFDISSTMRPVKQALDLINKKYLSNRNVDVKPGFYFGSDGIAMSLAETYRNGLLDADAAMISEWSYLLSGTSSTMGLGEGLAGQGLSNLGCAPFLDGTRERYFAEELMSRQQPEGNWLLAARRRLIFMEFGQTGIIYFLLRYGAVNKDSGAVECAIKGIHYLMNIAEKIDGKVTWRKKHQSSNSRWCEGNPGIGLLFLRAFELTREPVYREWVDLTLNGHDESKLWSSLSLCHGISGLGETYLEAAKILQDDKWFSKAANCAQILMHMQLQTKHGGAFWFMERERHPVGNLFIGTTGAMHFLLRYLNLDRFGFPGLF